MDFMKTLMEKKSLVFSLVKNVVIVLNFVMNVNQNFNFSFKILILNSNVLTYALMVLRLFNQILPNNVPKNPNSSICKNLLKKKTMRNKNAPILNF
jgi:hypothetical protein